MKSLFSARPYQLYFEHRPAYLFARVECEVMSYEIARGYWIEMLSMIHRRRYHRILVQKDVPQRLPAIELFDLVNELAHSACRSVSFAICDSQFDPEFSRLEETLATNRGLTWKVHKDLPLLENWLLSRSTYPSTPIGGLLPHGMSGKTWAVTC